MAALHVSGGMAAALRGRANFQLVPFPGDTATLVTTTVPVRPSRPPSWQGFAELNLNGPFSGRSAGMP
jgi:hypothetical protein